MLTVIPHITANGSGLSATTSFLTALFTLGTTLRKFHADRENRIVTIENRYFWFWTRRREIHFDQIAAVTYGYEDVSIGFSARDTIDRFVVGLRPKVGDEIRLFYFVGDGTFTNDGPLPDWWYWDDIIFDYTGSQAKESKMFVQLLSQLIGVAIVPSSLTPE